MRLVDLSHTIRDGLITYPGLPAPRVGSHLTFEQSHDVYADGTEFSIGRIEMVTNTGTYLDTPGHRWRDGHDLAGLPLERCALLPALVLDGGPGAIEADVLRDVPVEGHAVLFRTGWEAHFGTERYGAVDHPFLAVETAESLVDAGATLVGIDSVNIDATATGERPIHSTLLAAGIPVVEHLTNLAELPATGATFTAVPVKVAGLATFPVRAFATVGG